MQHHINVRNILQKIEKNVQHEQTIREIQKSIQHPREDEKNNDTKQHISCKHTTASNKEEPNRRKINITAKTKTLSIK